MDKQKNDRRADRAAEENRETMDFLAGKLDDATQCAGDNDAREKARTAGDAPRATDKVEEAVTAAADRVREKARK